MRQPEAITPICGGRATVGDGSDFRFFSDNYDPCRFARVHGRVRHVGGVEARSSIQVVWTVRSQ
jgi:hypothetical protein